MRANHGILSATTWTMLRGTAGSQYPPSKPAPTATSAARSGTTGVALTGTDIGTGATFAFGLAVVGALVLMATRRRATRSR